MLRIVLIDRSAGELDNYECACNQYFVTVGGRQPVHTCAGGRGVGRRRRAPACRARGCSRPRGRRGAGSTREARPARRPAPPPAPPATAAAPTAAV